VGVVVIAATIYAQLAGGPSRLVATVSLRSEHEPLKLLSARNVRRLVVFPLAFEHTFFGRDQDGKWVELGKSKGKFELLSVNRPPPDAEFTIDFPQGTMLWDQEAHRGYVVGGDLHETSWRQHFLFAGTGVGILFGAAAWVLHRRRLRAE
jgi:hypothetical protein